MQLSDTLIADLQFFTKAAGTEKLDREAFKRLCEHLRISKYYYDLELGEDLRYRDNRISKVSSDVEYEGNKVILYNDGSHTGLRLTYTYYLGEQEYVHSYQEFRIGIRKEDLDLEVLEFFSDFLYVIMSRQNMQKLLDISENSDALTGIPNIVFLTKKYKEVTQTVPADDLLVIRLNLQNFRYVNEAAGARAGDEAIIQYSRKLCGYVDDDEGVCRLGGDNFVLVIHKDHLDRLISGLTPVNLSNLKSAPGRNFFIYTWMGISPADSDRRRTFLERLNEASAACELGKGKLRKPVVFYDNELLETISQSRKIVSMFRPAIQRREFIPYFQPKVDLQTGNLVGFESLCRWKHEGHFIYPDQFIPILDKNSLIPELDLNMFKETCSSIRQWKNMGLDTPVISANFSKKDLFVPDIDQKIADIIDDFSLSPEDLEIEITESVKDTEYEQLMNFVRNLKKRGVRVSIDDFGTGYSSLSLIHNIDADEIKIDRSFVDKLPEDRKSKILIDSIINIAERLQMSVIAEGIETREQSQALIEMGCTKGQGYYFSKPVDFDEATRLIENPSFKAMIT